MKFHKTKDGRKIKLADLETSHLENIIKWIERKSKEGLTVRIGGGSCAEDMWHDEEICSTVTAGETNWRYFDGMACSDDDYILTGTFPRDYDFKTNSESGAKYMIGMSVPPVMTAQIAKQVYEQWLSKL